MWMIQGLVRVFQFPDASLSFQPLRRLIRTVERYQLAEIPQILALRLEIIRRFWIVRLRRRRVEMLDHCVSQSNPGGCDEDNDQDNDLAHSDQNAIHPSLPRVSALHPTLELHRPLVRHARPVAAVRRSAAADVALTDPPGRHEC